MDLAGVGGGGSGIYSSYLSHLRENQRDVDKCVRIL